MKDDPVLQFFEYGHLPTHLGAVSKLYHDLAQQVVSLLPDNTERMVALRYLLQSKDAAVRTILFRTPAQ